MTPHINAKKGEIAPTVIMSGDPLRARYIAENYLEDYKLVNDVRGMLAYTGKYKNKLVTIMGSGMGNPSMGIYSYELFKYYDVENIIRIGTTGAYTEDLNLRDVILATNSYSESTYAEVQNGCQDRKIASSSSLNKRILEASREIDIKVVCGDVHTTDVLYPEKNITEELAKEQNLIAGEMESFALFHNARVLGKQASCILTVSNSLITGAEMSSDERETSLDNMILLALTTLK